MANKIEDLKGFMEAVDKEHQRIISTADHFNLGFRDGTLSEHLHLRIDQIIRDDINESDYIKQWTKEV